MLFVTFQRLAMPRIGLLTNIKGFNKFFATFKIPNKNSLLISNQFLSSKSKFLYNKSLLVNKQLRNISTSCNSPLQGVKGIQENISALHMKKRPLRKKRSVNEDEEITMPGFWNVKSLATAEEYNLEGLMDGLMKQDLYLPEKICTSSKCE